MFFVYRHALSRWPSQRSWEVTGLGTDACLRPKPSGDDQRILFERRWFSYRWWMKSWLNTRSNKWSAWSIEKALSASFKSDFFLRRYPIGLEAPPKIKRDRVRLYEYVQTSSHSVPRAVRKSPPRLQTIWAWLTPSGVTENQMSNRNGCILDLLVQGAGKSFSRIHPFWENKHRLIHITKEWMRHSPTFPDTTNGTGIFTVQDRGGFQGSMLACIPCMECLGLFVPQRVPSSANLCKS